jgi:5-methylcytosine-specific restriction endonuclease McrA
MKQIQKGTHNDGKWTEGRYRGFITSALRSAMRRWPPKWDALKEACTGAKVNKKTKRLGRHYECAVCGGEFPQAGVQVDHKVPIGSCKTWDEFIQKLFCEKDNLQVLCKPCHKKKTKKEQT